MLSPIENKGMKIFVGEETLDATRKALIITAGKSMHIDPASFADLDYQFEDEDISLHQAAGVV